MMRSGPLRWLRLRCARHLAIPALLCLSCSASAPASLNAETPGIDEFSSPVSGDIPVGTVMVTTVALNFRSQPSKSSTVLDVLSQGASVTIVASSPIQGFYNVDHDGTIGWCSGKYLAVSSPGTGGSGGGGAGGSAGGGSSGAGGGSAGAGGAAGAQCQGDGAIFVAPDGADTAAGTQSAPFATMNHALAKAKPGNTVFVRAGVYHQLVSFPASGTQGAPIALRAWCGEHPILDATGLSAGAGEAALITIDGKKHLVVEGFELRNLAGSDSGFPAGIRVKAAAGDIALLDNDIHHITAPNGGDSSGAHGIAVYGTSTSPIDGVLIDGNRLHNLVLGWSEALVVNGNVRNFEVTNNIIHDVNNIAFDFIGFESDVCPGCSQADAVDVDDVNRARHGTVRGNLAYNMTTQGNPAYGSEKAAACYYVDGGASIVIERNIAHDCDLGVELASEHYAKSTRDVIVRGNFLYDNDVAGIATGGYDSGTGNGGGSASGCWIVNNTLFNCSRNGWAGGDVLLQNRNINNRFVNNIIHASSGSSAVLVSGAKNTGNLLDYNIYFNGSSSSASDGGHSITADPGLVSPSTGDLHLSGTSPAINSGTALGATVVGTQDIDGDARVHGAIDIGADEY